MLVYYGSAVVACLFCWYVVAPTFAASTAATAASGSGAYALIGFRVTRSSTLWNTSFVGDTVILIFAAIQVPQYRREMSGAHSRFVESVFHRRQWLHTALRTAIRVQRLVGAIACYVLYIVLSLVPDGVIVGGGTTITKSASFRKLATIVVALLCIMFHMFVGIRKGSGHSAKLIPRLLFVMAVLQVSVPHPHPTPPAHMHMGSCEYTLCRGVEQGRGTCSDVSLIPSPVALCSCPTSGRHPHRSVHVPV